MLEFIYAAFEFITLYYVTKKFSASRMCPDTTDIINLFLYVIISGSILPLQQLIGFCFVQLYYGIYIFIKYKKEGFAYCFYLYCLSMMYMVLAQYICVILISLTPLDVYGDFIGLIGNTMTLFLSILLLQIPFLRDLHRTIMRSALPYRMILLNSYIVLFLLMLVSKISPANFYGNIYFVVIAVLFLILANICVLYYDQKMYIQKKELDSYQKNLPIYQSLIDEIRASQHEFSNRIQSLRCLPETCGTYEELALALQEYTGSYTRPLHAYPLLQINMPLLAAALYHLSSKAEKGGIRIQYDVESGTLQSHAPENQLADFTCILLQNAIEASQPGDHIYVHFTSSGGKVEFEVRNPVPDFYPQDHITKFFQKGYSTKKDLQTENGTPHGLGLYYLLRQIPRYEGIITADCIPFQDKYWMVFRLCL